MSSRVVIGIEMGESTTKLVEFDHDTGTVLDLEIKETDDIDEIKNYLVSKTGDANKDVECVFSIRSQNSIVRSVLIPKEIKDVDEYIRWEIENYICDSLDQYYYDAQILPVEGEELYKRAMVVATRKVDVEGIIKQSRELNVPLGVVDMDVFAAINALEIMKEDVDSSGHNIIIKADQDVVAVIWVYQFLMEKLISIPVTVEAFSEGEFSEITQAIEQEITTAVFAITKKEAAAALEEGTPEGAEPEAEEQPKEAVAEEGEEIPEASAGKANVFVCGDLAENEDFMGALKSDLSRKMVKLNPFTFAKLSPDCDKPAMEAPAAAALGLAMRDSLKANS
ncbi:MAG: pilus assembly protein PilM [Fibrobacterales bacterium]